MRASVMKSGLLVAFALVGACAGGSDGTDAGERDQPVNGAAGSGDWDEPTCDAWALLASNEQEVDAEDAAAALRIVRAIDIDAGIDFELIEDTLELVVELEEEFGSLDDVTPADLNESELRLMTDGGQEAVAIGSTNELSLAAFENCDGAPDPRFVLPCAYSTFQAIDTGGPPEDDGPLPEIEEEAQSYLDRTPGATSFVLGPLDDGKYRLALLDADEVAVKVVELVPKESSWFAERTSDCAGPG